MHIFLSLLAKDNEHLVYISYLYVHKPLKLDHTESVSDGVDTQTHIHIFMYSYAGGLLSMGVPLRAQLLDRNRVI